MKLAFPFHMRTYHFTLRYDFERNGEPFIVGEELLEQVEVPLYTAFEGAITVAVSGSTAIFHCHIPAASVEVAVAQVVGALASLGLRPALQGVLGAPMASVNLPTVEMPAEDILGRPLETA